MVAREDLCQRWIHSHEEDSEDTMVFRPQGFAFPRARGRVGFELRSDGSAVEIGIGRGDAPEEAEGSWAFENEGEPRIRIQTDAPRVVRVISVDARRLVVRKS